jgi:hypothetical protein
MAPGRDCNVVFSCVTENDPAWFQRVANLVSSVRWFGGSLSDATFIVNFVGDVAPEYSKALRDLDAQVRVVERVDSRAGFANKLRMLELDRDEAFDALVGLDCDVVVVDDFSDEVPASSIGAKPADYDLFTDREWSRLYETVGMQPPPRTQRATSSGKPVGPYFNTGVLTVPRALCGELSRRWTTCHTEIVARFERDPNLIRPDLQVYSDQLALSLAIAEGGMPWEPLPVTMNFPSHVPVHRSALSGRAPMIVHYHDEIDADGFLRRPRCSIAADSADRFNRRRAQELDLEYGGLRRPSPRESFRRAIGDRLQRNLARRHRLRARIVDLVRRRPRFARPR